MKIIFYLLTVIVLVVMVGWVINRNQMLVADNTIQNGSPTADAHETYRNPRYGYVIKLPAGLAVDESVPELVVIENDLVRVRVNYGCYDFGVEGLRKFSVPTVIGDETALVESYYDDDKLVYKRIVLEPAGKCVYLEYWAREQLGWQDAEELVKSFRTTE